MLLGLNVYNNALHWVVLFTVYSRYSGSTLIWTTVQFTIWSVIILWWSLKKDGKWILGKGVTGTHTHNNKKRHSVYGEDDHCDPAWLVGYWHSCRDPPKTRVDSIDRINLKSMQPWPLVKQQPRPNRGLQSRSLSITTWSVFSKASRPRHTNP